MPIFDVIVILKDFHTMEIFRSAAEAVDSILKGEKAKPEIRVDGVVTHGPTRQTQEGKVKKTQDREAVQSLGNDWETVTADRYDNRNSRKRRHG